MSDNAEIKVGSTVLNVPIIEGSEQERALDISQLRAKTGLVTLDPAFMNTASTKSAITYLDGEKGILRYRGIPIEQLAEHSTFVEVAYLLIYGDLPTEQQLQRFSTLLTRHSLIHEDMKHFFEGFPSTAHPMAVLAAMVVSLGTYYPDALDVENVDQVEITISRLISKVRTIAAFAYKKSIGQPFVYPKNSLKYCGNFLNMMFSVPAEPYEVDPELEKVMNLLLILHADHEQNASTSTVRLSGSSGANPFACIAAGIASLWGPAHGGANEAVLKMLGEIGSVERIPLYIARAKDKDDPFRLMGFGHRVYKNYDPRAKIMQQTTREVLNELGVKDVLLDVALELERIALHDEYFIEKKLYPNIDFYSGITLKAMNFPTTMFTVLFAVARTVGWIAQWKEMIEDSGSKIGRPRQLYTGEVQRDYVPMTKRV